MKYILLLVLHNVAALQTTYVDVACMLLTSRGVAVLESNYSHPYPERVPTVILQTGWMQGYQLVSNLVHARGGIPVFENNTESRVFLNVTMYSVGRPEDNATTTITENKLALMNSLAPNTLVFDAPIQDTEASPYMPLIDVCQQTRSCLLMLPIAIDESLFKCRSPLPSYCIRGGARPFDMMLSVAPPSKLIVPKWLGPLLRHNIQTMYVIRSIGSFSALADAAVVTATGLGIRIVGDEAFDPKTEEGVGTVESWKAIVQRIIIQNPHTIITSMGYVPAEATMCVLLLNAMRLLDYTPPAIMHVGSCHYTAPYVLPDLNLWNTHHLGDYNYAVVSWDPRFRGADYDVIPQDGEFSLWPNDGQKSSPAVFYESMLEAFGAEADFIATASTFAMGEIIKWIQHANKRQPTMVDLSISALLTPRTATHYGKGGFDRYGRREDSEYEIIQLMPGGAAKFLSPSPIAELPTYPAPTYWERDPLNVPPKTGLEQAVVATTIALQVILCISIIAIIIYRENPVLKAASPPLLVTSCAGALLWSSSNYTWQIHATVSDCHARIWLLECGSTIIFGAVALKAWRIQKIFNTPDIRLVIITNARLILMLVIAVVVDGIVILIWTMASRPYVDRVVTDVHRPALDDRNCVFESNDNSGLFFILTMKGLLLVALLYLTHSLRNVTARFNESFQIWFVTFAVFVTFLVGIPVVFLSSDKTYNYVIRSGGVLAVTVWSLTILIFTKFISGYQADESAKGVTKASSAHDSGQALTGAAKSIESIPPVTARGSTDSPGRPSDRKLDPSTRTNSSGMRAASKQNYMMTGVTVEIPVNSQKEPVSVFEPVTLEAAKLIIKKLQKDLAIAEGSLTASV